MKAEKITGLATSLVWNQENFAAQVSYSDGKRHWADLTTLSIDGIPSPNGVNDTFSQCVVTDMKTWRECSPNEYLNVFGLKAEATEDLRHQLFCFTEQEHTYLIPALALIRGLILPNRYLLADAFNQSFLERTVHLDIVSKDTAKLTLVGHENLARSSRKLAYQSSIYRWFASYPSATKMVHSIHRHARAGWIGLDLPEAKVELSVHGTCAGNTTYVQSIRLLKLIPQESADFFFEGQSKELEINYPLIERRKSTIRPSSQYSIPTFKDEVIDVSTVEWNAICRYSGLIDFESTAQSRERLMVFNAILKKLHSGAPWNELDCGPMGYRKAAARFLYWHNSGRFSAMLEALQSIRGT